MFFIYLYQRWIYRVDPKRVNEFGTSGEDAAHPPDSSQQEAEDIVSSSAGGNPPITESGSGVEAFPPEQELGNDPETLSVQEKKNQ